MPLQRNNAGTAEGVVPYVNQSGSPVECNVYANQNGTPVLVHEVGGGGGGETETMLEDWESGSIGSAWTVDSSGFSVEQDGTLNGSYNLVQSGGAFARLWSYEGDGLPEYVSRGESIEFLSWTDTQDDYASGIYFGVVDASNNYFTRYNNDFQLVEKVGGGNSVIEAETASMPANTVVKWRVDWFDGSGGRTAGDMDLTVTRLDTGEELASFSTNSTNVEDNTGENGAGVGVWYQANGVNRFDDIKKIVRDGGDDGGGGSEPSGTVVIDFEDQDLSAFDSGSVEDFNFQTSGAPQGDVWLQLTGTAGYAQMGSQSGLNAYPQQGDEFTCYVYLGEAGASTAYTYFAWGAQSGGDTSYFTRAHQADGIFELELDGTNYSTSYNFGTDEWYRLRVQWDDGSTFGGSAGDYTAYLEDLSGNVLETIGPYNDAGVTGGGIELGGTNEPGWDGFEILNR